PRTGDAYARASGGTWPPRRTTTSIDARVESVALDTRSCTRKVPADWYACTGAAALEAEPSPSSQSYESGWLCGSEHWQRSVTSTDPSARGCIESTNSLAVGGSTPPAPTCTDAVATPRWPSSSVTDSDGVYPPGAP